MHRAPPLVLALVALVVIGCGDWTPQPRTTSTTNVTTSPAPRGTRDAGSVVLRPPPRAVTRVARILNLTTALSPAVLRVCTASATKTATTTYCPPLVPSGPVHVEGLDGITTSRDFQTGFVANFDSRSVKPSRSAPGHWIIAEGNPQALRTLLHPANYNPREGRTTKRALTIAGIRATLWSMPSFRIFHSIFGGHTVITWRCAGREFHASMHGHSNTRRTILLATGLAYEMPRSCRH